MGRARVPVEQRFWRNVDLPCGRPGGADDCWLWRGKQPSVEYPVFTIEKGMTITTHRYSYLLTHGYLPTGHAIHVCHSCDEPRCVNPRHLWLGTAKANFAEMIVRGRKKRGEAHRDAKLTEDDVRAIRARYVKDVTPIGPIANRYGVSKSAIGSVIHRRSWGYLD